MKSYCVPENRIERWAIDIERLMKGEDVRVHTLIDKELVELDKLYARIGTEKQALRFKQTKILNYKTID